MTAVAAVTGTGLVGVPAAPARVSAQTLSLSGTLGSAARSVKLPNRPEMVGFTWSGGAAGIEVRALVGSQWSPWAEVDGNPDEGPDPGSTEANKRVGAGPVWLGRDAEQIEVRAEHGRPTSVEVVALDSEPGRPALGGPAPAAALPAQPGIVSRAQWGADESLRQSGPGCDGSVAYASTVRNAFVHHTVSVNAYGPDESDDLIRGIYQFHTQSRGWCDIGYNFIVDRFGRIYEGRYGGVDRAVIGAHAGGFNTGSTGVSILGDHGSTPVPTAARSALVRLLAWKLGHHGIDPRTRISATSGGSSRYSAGTVVDLPAIAGHRDVSSTACPGEQAYDLLPRLRIDVQAEQLATRPHPLPGWQPDADSPRLAAVTSFGGLHPAGGQPSIPDGPYWAGFPIARAAASSAAGGVILDGYGGLHGFGGVPSPRVSSYWPGWDIARGVAMGSVPQSGWVLDGFGGLHRFGGAPPALGAPYFGFDIARGVATTGELVGGYVLDGYGAIHAFGTSPRLPSSVYWYGWDIARAVALRADGRSGYVLDGWGGIHPFGGAPKVSSPSYTPGRDKARALVLNPTGPGGWMSDADGRVLAFGGAPPARTSLTYTDSNAGRALVLLTASGPG